MTLSESFLARNLRNRSKIRYAQYVVTDGPGLQPAQYFVGKFFGQTEIEREREADLVHEDCASSRPCGEDLSMRQQVQTHVRILICVKLLCSCQKRGMNDKKGVADILGV